MTDVIIIGAGSAGLSAAKALTKLGFTSNIIEGSDRRVGRGDHHSDGVLGDHQIMPMRSSRAKPGRVHIRFGDPIPTDGMSEDNACDPADHLQQEASRIYAELKDLSGSVQ